MTAADSWVISATGHTCAEPAATDWTRTKSGDACTATVAVNCVEGDDPQTIEATVEKTSETAAQHLEDGSVTYTATATVGKQTLDITQLRI